MVAPQSVKVGDSLLGKAERRFIAWALPKIPSWVKSHHLTNLSLLWGIGILVFAWIARENGQIYWLHGVSLMLLLHWLTDSLDGSLGRTRGEGLVKWGFYMDHLYDFFLLGCLLLGYNYVMPELVLHVATVTLSFFQVTFEIEYRYLLFFIYILLSIFMVNSFLYFGATQKFKIAYLGIGPTEVRGIFIIINTLIVIFGKTYMTFALPYVLAFLVIGIIVMVWRTQRELWLADKALLDNKTGNS